MNIELKRSAKSTCKFSSFSSRPFYDSLAPSLSHVIHLLPQSSPSVVVGVPVPLDGELLVLVKFLPMLFSEWKDYLA
jgi:hypothetical protein